MNIDTTGIALSNLEEVRYKRLFEYFLRLAKLDRVKGNVVIPLDGAGGYGQVKIESYIDVSKS